MSNESSTYIFNIRTCLPIIYCLKVVRFLIGMRMGIVMISTTMKPASLMEEIAVDLMFCAVCPVQYVNALKEEKGTVEEDSQGGEESDEKPAEVEKSAVTPELAAKPRHGCQRRPRGIETTRRWTQYKRVCAKQVCESCRRREASATST